MDRTIPIKDFPDISIFNDSKDFKATTELLKKEEGVFIYKFSASSENPATPQPITLRWRIPAINLKGVWKCGSIHDKRQQYDWELEHLQSRISVDAPVISVFGFNDTNTITFACSDAINLLEMNALLREEDNHLYCHITFFSERHPEITNYNAEIRVDLRSVLYSQSLQDVTAWWETFENLKPHPAPPIAIAPMYSTWYQFHQDLDETTLLEECKIASSIGYELLLLDDGWQTMDNNRGYDYTGDWRPDRFEDMVGFVEKVHQTGMKIGLWYSVPFCGKKSKAYQRFKGKFLTEDHRWAPVFDVRYPDVRQYLIDTYTNAVKDWNLDVLKLDFIDDFKVYPETVLTKENSRDYANVNAAVDRLLTDVMKSLRAVKPDIGIEFRQKYIGPVLRKFGNMFRAFDCPNDPVSNRIRTSDVKLLMGDSVVHSDMLTWHGDEKVELAALQVLNGFYAVPQLSVLLKDVSPRHLNMIKFYTNYWKENADILLKGKFQPMNPLANYPILKAEKNKHAIIGIYDDMIAEFNGEQKIDILNAKTSKNIVLRNKGNGGAYHLSTFDCEGNMKTAGEVNLPKGLIDLEVPEAGMISIRKI